MTSTDRPVTTQEKLDYLDAELKAARHCIDCYRLEDAIRILMSALVEVGALRSRYRMVTNPEDV